jgi:hypothetical protein
MAMETEKTIVESFCGIYPTDFVNIDILSNPNFVFENDPKYQAIKLFDVDGNAVFVNSFLECQHYVKGGWDYIPNLINESFFHNFLAVVALFSLTAGTLVIQKYFK